jgi:hypothetical protein
MSIDAGNEGGLRRRPSLAGANARAYLAWFVILAAALMACGAGRIHSLDSLPDRMSLCGRTWIKDHLERQLSLGQIRAWQGVEPVVADPGFLAPCPAGACTGNPGDSPCHVVLWVRVAEDAYVDYSLSGGP